MRKTNCKIFRRSSFMELEEDMNVWLGAMSEDPEFSVISLDQELTVESIVVIILFKSTDEFIKKSEELLKKSYE